jgi:3D (Asp-Asp-Asp) domain-containing protein
MIATAAAIVVSATAYSPCSSGTVMADGTHTRWGSVASNHLRMHTRIRFTRPIHGRHIFTVRDRGSAGMQLDVFMPSCRDAVRFGRQRRAFRVIG